MAMEIFGFAREMSGQTTQLVGQIRAQAEVQRQDAKQREEAQKVEALRREEAQRVKFRPNVQKFKPSVQMLRLNGLRPNSVRRPNGRKLRPRELKLGRERRCWFR